ncbi:ubiquinone biosynthesis protein COQ9 [Acetobacter conturbans]|uniref:COQ9 C-terminal domain-containing protein n=1 Tax=Acetobacter conturbans TaxID=1737472 RepID=A0ABX0K254_9PROT|nr:hypothetical protein [Acetobacter conturbans]NHN89741.1 hypothetical protein [Acetobacter conturbans]
MFGNARILQFIAGAGYGLMQTVTPPQLERTAERDAALRALAGLAGEKGWTIATLREAAGADADLLFPGGRVELIEAWADLVDRDMIERVRFAIDEGDCPRLSQRVRRAILERLELLQPYRNAERRASTLVLSPCSRGVSGRILGRTVNAIWLAAEDTSGGVTWATKRLSLTSIYIPTFLAWLGGADRRVVEQVLDNGLASARRIGELKRRVFRTQAQATQAA